MLQKESYIKNSDNSGIKKLKVFHMYRNGIGHIGSVNFFFCGSVQKRKLSQNPRLIKRYFRRKARGCIIRSRKYVSYMDNQYIRSYDNASTIFSKRIDRYNIKIKGPMFYANKRQKFFFAAKKII